MRKKGFYNCVGDHSSIKPLLGGGFNPFEKYESNQIGSFSQVGWKSKMDETPTQFKVSPPKKPPQTHRLFHRLLRNTWPIQSY